ncbi:uncharacterized protein LOC143163499 isoform X2 [Aptenodytes patagonicus]|uniref:uncharacterized protein LOC143163499 isoform X2 n=1 Tax=Aptenodytes patagonicus TaxID=9234 RepID=UPI003F9F2571
MLTSDIDWELPRMQDSIPQRKGALQRPLGYPRTPETLIIYIRLRSLCNYAGELNCKKVDVVILSEGDKHGIIPENHSHCLEAHTSSGRVVSSGRHSTFLYKRKLKVDESKQHS